MSEPEILFENRGVVGLITLNRPKSLNALTLNMVQSMTAKLAEWADDPAVATVVVRGAGDRAFSAGADIRAVRESGLAGTSYAEEFFRAEYALNALIKRYAKPYIAMVHGICMGGGLGLSVHGRYRVTGSSSIFAMPETAIGFFPDVGGSYFLSRLPGQVGLYLGLTGARVKAADSLYLKLATHWVPSEYWDGVIEGMASGDDPADVLSEIARDLLPSAPISDRRVEIDRVFAGSSVEDILAVLDQDEEDEDEWSSSTAALLRGRSPTSLKLTYNEIRFGKTLSFEECMRMEFRMVKRILEGKDFYEGVRAVLVDKDNAPKWDPPALGDVSLDDIQSYFAPIEKELVL
ncbi:enoyl-CoA hydratase/carnithine racemase [Rhizomicrobium palustre]|uniref:3-hydroxyisobutyryl-CoA hydrolase n=1 Tax=Rhizomicrobium palustre TaxID=189966 RepID=A0A846N3Y2_9PROT|nr:enoyl-CoA hydratase/carnithine racemase [Rhizomicrobium palustre]